MTRVNLKLFKILTSDLKLSDENAIQFIEAIREMQLETYLEHQNKELRSSVKEEHSKLEFKTDLGKQMEDTKNTLIRWFVAGVFIIDLLILGLYFKLS